MQSCWIVTLDVLKLDEAEIITEYFVRWIVTLDVLKFIPIEDRYGELCVE